jgi:hypothetical protein
MMVAISVSAYEGDGDGSKQSNTLRSRASDKRRCEDWSLAVGCQTAEARCCLRAVELGPVRCHPRGRPLR